MKLAIKKYSSITNKCTKNTKYWEANNFDELKDLLKRLNQTDYQKLTCK